MEIDELCNAVEAWRLAKQPNHEDFCAQMAASASVNLEEYINQGNEPAALQRAIYLAGAAVGCSTSTHPDRERILAICHQVFWHKYLHNRDPRDLNYALRVLFEEVKLHPFASKTLIGPYASISDIYLERFNRWRLDDDIQKATMYGYKAVCLFSPDVREGAYQLYRRGLAFIQAFESDGSEASLNSAIRKWVGQYALLGALEGRIYGSDQDIEAALYWSKRAYEKADNDNLLKATYAYNLSNRYYQRYKRKTKSLWDLDQAIGLIRSLSKNELELDKRASSLALQLLDRYRVFGDTAALAECVQIARTILNVYVSEEDHMSRAKVEHVASLCLEGLYEYSQEAGVLEEALSHAEIAVTYRRAPRGVKSEISDTLNRLTSLKKELELSRPKNLCKGCAYLPNELFVPGSARTCQLFAGPDALSQLQQSAEGGCHLCVLIKDVLDCSPVANLDENAELLLRAGRIPSFLGSMWTSPWSCWLTVRLGAQDVGRLRIFNDHDSNRPDDPPIDESSELPISIETEIFTASQFAMMNSWLDKCMSEHPDCNRRLVSSTPFELPSRLIEVTSDAGNYNLRLVETQGWSAKGHSYAALSHCWGTDLSNIPRMTKENLSAMKQSIKFSTLSATFQQAVKVTQGLRIPYLWIDSLCIVQDDPEDWAHESSNMHRIYESALITFVASASPDGNAGLCRPRDATHQKRINTCQFPSLSPKGTTKITVYPHLGDWENSIEAGPLSKRGWCFQERQLSRRMIHFTEMRILWECNSFISSEDQKEMRYRPVDAERVMTGTGRLWDTRGGQDAMKAALGEDFGTELAPRQTFIPAKWCQVVEEYSRRRLSYEKDKLPALSGLAHTVSEFLHGTDTYLAGLWKMYLARDLSWFPDVEIGNSSPRGEGDVSAPSWSWASYTGPVSYHMIEDFESEADEHERLAPKRITKSWEDSPLQVISADITPAGLDPLGRVRSGAKIIVSSIVVDISISEAYYLPRFNPRKPDWKCYSMFKGPGLSGMVVTDGWTVAYDRREAIRHGYICFDENPDKLSLMEFSCLRLGKGVSRTDQVGEGAEKVDTGLLLVKVEGSDQYKRVGIFEVGPNDEDWIARGQLRTLALV
ncbi:HET-domain-containing protein [Stipitochalara longipes BDJ]|nr:HET-domain-containing protein [Stipitochalara longipes BDJ]